MSGVIILLNGASSSGKSSLARGLQGALEAPFWHFSIDHLISAKVLPMERIDSGEFPWSDLRTPFFDGFHTCIPALARAGNNLIVEHIVETESWMRKLLDLLDGLDVYFIGVHCPLSELERRELERGDRRIGGARTDFETAHTFATYDFEVDSTLPLEESIAAVVGAWRARKRPGAFERMRSNA